ncbi:unnamed protein product [Phytophthora fragariaefolia]|uniref:Unnamed protein product n=1 Tax=Phytophthora fragariaefolia TaxID=1490495 RepID=A0A9W7D2G4_9STRA|nr:unnamed protein product [Phytophthora fragariaefolia]
MNVKVLTDTVRDDTELYTVELHQCISIVAPDSRDAQTHRSATGQESVVATPSLPATEPVDEQTNLSSDPTEQACAEPDNNPDDTDYYPVQHALMDTSGWATCSVATIHSRRHYYWQKAIDICQLGACIRTEFLPTTRCIHIQFSFSTKRLIISLYLD